MVAKEVFVNYYNFNSIWVQYASILVKSILVIRSKKVIVKVSHKFYMESRLEPEKIFAAPRSRSRKKYFRLRNTANKFVQNPSILTFSQKGREKKGDVFTRKINRDKNHKKSTDVDQNPENLLCPKYGSGFALRLLLKHTTFSILYFCDISMNGMWCGPPVFLIAVQESHRVRYGTKPRNITLNLRYPCVRQVH